MAVADQVVAHQQDSTPAVAPESGAEPVISTRGLGKRFDGTFSVQDVTFDVPPGIIFGFIGPSGSGKTTTVRLLTGIYAPTEGEVRVLGSNPQKFSRRTRTRIGYMPQLFVLYPHLTVWENLNFAASLYGMRLRRARQMQDVLDFVELSDARGKLARDISGGMQRRLSLAATLIHNPDLIFLDEPTAGIDPVLRQKFWERFREMKGQERTLFITTQYVNEATYCDLIGVMQDGHLVAVDTPLGLRHRAYGGDMVDLITTDRLDYLQEEYLRRLPYVRNAVRLSPYSVRVVVDEAGAAIPQLIEWGRSNNLNVKSIEEYVPPFDDVFVELVKPEVASV